MKEKRSHSLVKPITHPGIHQAAIGILEVEGLEGPMFRIRSMFRILSFFTEWNPEAIFRMNMSALGLPGNC